MNKIGSQFSTSLVASLTLKTDTWWQYQMRLVQQLGRYTMVHFTNVNANATWNMSRRSTVYSNQIRNGSLTVANSSQFSIELQFTIQKWIFCSAAFQEWFCRGLFLRLRGPLQTTLTRKNDFFFPTLRVRWS